MKGLTVRVAVVFQMLAAASAATYSFTNIIDSTVAAPNSNYLDIGDEAISGNKVAFKAGYNQGFLGIIDSIFTSSGGPRTEIDQELATWSSGGTFSAFRSRRDPALAARPFARHRFV